MGDLKTRKGYIEFEYRPGPCSGCIRVITDERGIIFCELSMMRCSDANPGHDCGSRLIDKIVARMIENDTNAIIKNARKAMVESDKLIAELESLRKERK